MGLFSSTTNKSRVTRKAIKHCNNLLSLNKWSRDKAKNELVKLGLEAEPAILESLHKEDKKDPYLQYSWHENLAKILIEIMGTKTETLMQLIVYENKFVRKEAICVSNDYQNSTLVNLLKNVLNDDEDDDVKLAAIAALGRYQNSKAIEILLLAFDKRSKNILINNKLKNALISSFKSNTKLILELDTCMDLRVMNSSTIDFLIDQLLQLKDNRVINSISFLVSNNRLKLSTKSKHSIIKLLEDVNDENAVKLLIQLLDNSNLVIKESIAKTLGRIGNKEAISSLLQLLDEDDYKFKIVIIEIIEDFNEPIITDKLNRLLKNTIGQISEFEQKHANDSVDVMKIYYDDDSPGHSYYHEVKDNLDFIVKRIKEAKLLSSKIESILKNSNNT